MKEEKRKPLIEKDREDADYDKNRKVQEELDKAVKKIEKRG